MEKTFPGGVWPVMLTPFKDREIDYQALEELIQWYLASGVSGLFAVCQSSEMFHLTDRECQELASFIKEKAGGTVPVIASGHTADRLEQQAEQIIQMHETGVDAVVLITNRLANEEDGEEVFEENLHRLLAMIPAHIALGLYECPFPYKRLLSPNMLKKLAHTNRFYFLKDTSCDIKQIEAKLKVVKGTPLRVYNANTATLLSTLRAGVVGYSGVMANFQPDLYSWLMQNYEIHPQTANELQHFLSMTALIERQHYPANAKYYLHQEGLQLWTEETRVYPSRLLTDTEKMEIAQLRALTTSYRKRVLGLTV
ncbi:dihydrodipicolinate synthase family protein [Shouchella clausii]|uniref:dihydrodipicolinate synthase family protein n=1 Tax=Shouchella clausii TaxID=79880 RepID=UPI0031FDDE6D